ncbi:MAG: hypothetical protein QXN55_02130 [Candidatus Nitrosotenuis sp.]
MVNVEGSFEGELKLDSIKFSKIVTRMVMKNNATSGKILLPYDLIDQEVVVLLPKSNRKKKSNTKK